MMANLESQIFAGFISHRRHIERAHSFRYRLFMLFLDLDDLETIAKRFFFFGINRTRPISFWRKDYLPSQPAASLKTAAIRVIKEQTGREFEGRVFILTHPRWFGYVMNPLTLYYCYNTQNQLEYIIGEITNTPWGERHCYVMPCDESNSAIQTFRFDKAFHVSPFLPMNMDYTWKIARPDRTLTVNITNHVKGRLDFEAHLTLRGQPLTSRGLLHCWMKDPWITLKVLIGIYWHAGLLYLLKRVTFYPHSHRQFKPVKETK